MLPDCRLLCDPTLCQQSHLSSFARCGPAGFDMIIHVAMHSPMFVFIELAPFAGQWCQKSAEGSEAQGLYYVVSTACDFCRFINCNQRSVYIFAKAAGEGEEAGQIKTGIFRGSLTQCVGAAMWKSNCIVQGPSHLQDGVWDYIREKDKAALEEGAFMETFAGKAVETTVYVLSFLIILWEIYLNTCISCSKNAENL